MSVNDHSTGAFDQPPFSITGNTRDFLGSPVHDRGVFRLYQSWIMGNVDGILAWPNDRWEIRSPPANHTSGYLRSTFTNQRPMVAGIYGMWVPRRYDDDYTVFGLDTSDSAFSIWLYGSNGQRVRVTAPDFGTGYTTLPTGILQQQSNATPDGNGGFTTNDFSWVLGSLLRFQGGPPAWYYVFDTRLLFGNSTAFWPQVVRPVVGGWLAAEDTGALFLNVGYRREYTFFSLNVIFDRNRNAWVALNNDSYPAQTKLLSPGFPSQYLDTSGFLNLGIK